VRNAPEMNAISMDGYRRRRDAELRSEPLASGRRDPDGRPPFDPEGRAYRAAIAHLEQVLATPGTPPAVAASLAVVLHHEEAA